MKYIRAIILCTLLMFVYQTAMAMSKTEPVHSPKLVKISGIWFLRSQDECTEIKLNRKGRSDKSLFQRDLFLDRKSDYLYLTVKQYDNTYTYRLLPLEWNKSYALEILAVAPHTPPKGDKKPLETIYNGIFREMVDCQLGPFHSE